MAELEHGPECDCGCNEEDDMTITLEFDDGESVLCDPIGIFEVDGKEYLALEPVDETSDEVFIYGYHEIGEDEFELLDIEDDETFDKVTAEFDRIVEEAAALEEE